MKKNNRIILFSHSAKTEVTNISSENSENNREVLRARYNDYYLKVSELFRKLQYIGIFALVVYLLSAFLFFGENITYQNARFILRDLGQILTEEDGEPISQFILDPDGDMDFAIYNGNIVVAGESGVKMISPSGKIRLEDSNIYISPKIISSGKYCIVYSPGAYNLSVYNTITRVYDFEFDYPIVDVSVSDNGDIAVMSSSREYRTAVYLYNSDFSLVATYNMKNYPSSVALSSNGENIYICVFSSVSGDYLTQITVYKKNQKEAYARYEKRSVLPYQIISSKNGSVSLVSDTEITVFNSELAAEDVIELTEGISKYTVTDNGFSLFTKEREPRVLSFDDNMDPSVLSCTEAIEKSYCFDNRTFLLTKTSVSCKLSEDSFFEQQIPPGAVCLIYNNNYIFVCYSDKILSFECKQ